jgi:hypothetical protein
MPNSKKDYDGIEPCAVGSTVEVLVSELFHGFLIGEHLSKQTIQYSISCAGVFSENTVYDVLFCKHYGDWVCCNEQSLKISHCSSSKYDM